MYISIQYVYETQKAKAISKPRAKVNTNSKVIITIAVMKKHNLMMIIEVS